MLLGRSQLARRAVLAASRRGAVAAIRPGRRAACRARLALSSSAPRSEAGRAAAADEAPAQADKEAKEEEKEQDEGEGKDSEKEKKKKKKKKGRPMWHYMVTAGPLILYYLDRRRELKPVEKEAEESLVGAYTSEVRELIDRVELTEADLRGVFSEVRRRYPSVNEVSPELVGEVVREAIVLPDATFAPWEVLALFRLSPEDVHGRVPCDELFVGLSQLATVAQDEVLPAYEALADVEGHRYDFEKLRLQFDEAGRRRLSLLWSAMGGGAGGEGGLTRSQLEAGLERMVRTGHVRPLSLVRKTQHFPPKFAVASAAEISRLVFLDLGLSAETGGRVTREAFEQEMRELTKADLFTLWYLEDTKQGLLKRFYEKRRERVVRDLRERGYDV